MTAPTNKEHTIYTVDGINATPLSNKRGYWLTERVKIVGDTASVQVFRPGFEKQDKLVEKRVPKAQLKDRREVLKKQFIAERKRKDGRS